jgi:hypothetical protein
MSYSLSLFAAPAAAEEDLVQELPGAHMLSIRVLSEVVGCVFVAVIFLKIETAQAPEGVDVILETSFFHNPPGASGLRGRVAKCFLAKRTDVLSPRKGGDADSAGYLQPLHAWQSRSHIAALQGDAVDEGAPAQCSLSGGGANGVW